MNVLTSKLRAFAQDERATTNIEYVLIASTVAVVAYALFDSMGFSLTGFFTTASDNIRAG